jgi:tRNA dimethylallyltransferase
MYDYLTILGPTASGKTSLAVQICRHINGQIISADSRQVYRGLDIGTGKDLSEYSQGGTSVTAHMIDLCPVDDEYNLFRYVTHARHLLRQIIGSLSIPVLCGGTGLYLSSLIFDYKLSEAPPNLQLRQDLGNMDLEAIVSRLLELKPSLHNTTDVLDRDRAARALEIALAELKDPSIQSNCPATPCSSSASPLHSLTIGIHLPRNVLRDSIRKRLYQRLDQGMLEEVQSLIDSGTSFERLDSLGLEYRYLSRYLKGDMSLDEAVDTLYIKICQFAKRQMTWFRKMERSGLEIYWLDSADTQQLLSLITSKTNWLGR